MGNEINPYERFTMEEMILRDHLAIDRTILANERTFLAYMRTSLAFGAVGGTLVEFLNSRFTCILGYALIVAGVLVVAVGAWRFRAMNARIAAAQVDRK